MDKGMFSDEVAVSYPPKGTPVCSVFVPIQEVRGQVGTTGKVRVRIVQRQGKLFAVLPSNYSDSVNVDEGRAYYLISGMCDSNRLKPMGSGKGRKRLVPGAGKPIW